jgi:hypothetical protein
MDMRRFAGMRRVAGAIAVAGLLVAPGAAHAANVDITLSADPAEDVPYQVTLSGSTDVQREVVAAIKPAGGRACAPGQSADDGSRFADTYVQGSYSKVYNLTSYDSGDYVLCAWLQDRSSDPNAVATATKAFTVRVPHASGTVQAPTSVVAGSVFQINVTVQTEVSREVLVAVNAPGVPCGANYNANQRVDTLIDTFNQGGPTTYTSNFTAPDGGGAYTVCGYVQEQSGDTVAEAAFHGPFTVLGAACLGARNRVATFTASAARHARAAKTFAKRARKARGKRRRAFAHRAAAELRAARANRAALAAAQHDVATQCPS